MQRQPSKRADDFIADRFLICEHTPVITMGKSASRTTARVGRRTARRGGLFRRQRGGDHLPRPGQPVGYPIFKLRAARSARLRKKDGRERHRALAAFELTATPLGPSGVFVGGAKIASIGAAVRRSVTYHGFALDVCTDLSYYRLIIRAECRRWLSLQRAKRNGTTVEEVKPLIRTAFTVFGIKFEDAIKPQPPRDRDAKGA